MPRRLSKIRKLLIVAGMLVPVLLLIGVGIVLQRSHQSLLTSSRWVSHTLEVESSFARLQSMVAEAESAQRGFLLTQSPDFPPQIDARLEEIFREQKRLLTLTHDNASQQQRLKKLDDVINARIDIIRQTTSLVRSGQREEAMKIVEGGRGPGFTADTRHLIHEASAEEDALFETREAALVQRSALQVYLTYVLIGLAGLVVLGVLLLLWHMQRAQALVTVCAWSKTIEHNGEWLSFEDYLQRRFGFNISHGISPEEAAKFTEDLASRRKQKERAAA